jgi:hypothetical protein
MNNILSLLMRTSALSGAKYTNELLGFGYNRRVKKTLRMDKTSFDTLIAWEKEGGFLQETKNVAVGEQLMMSLMLLDQGLSNRAIQEQFQHSGETVSQLVLH